MLIIYVMPLGGLIWQKNAGVLTDVRYSMANPFRKWGLRALMAASGSMAQPAMHTIPVQQAHVQALNRLGGLRSRESAQALRDTMYKLPDAFAKTSAVPSDVKQYRRAVQALTQGGHDFHGSGNLGGIVGSGGLQQGARNTFGQGVYYTQDRPAWEYWKDTFAHGPREGGVIVPRGVTQSQPAKMFTERPGAYRVGPGTPLSRDVTMVADASKPSAMSALQDAQRKYHVRPLKLDALRKAFDSVHAGAAPLQTRALYDKAYGALSKTPVVSKALGTLERGALAAKNLIR